MTVGNFKIDVIRKDIKNLHLAVYPPEGRVRIATPLHVDDEAVRLFAISKLSWIKQRMEKFEAQERQPPRSFISGESHYFEGHRYLLNVIECDATPKVVVRNNKDIDLYVRPGSTHAQRERVMQGFYRQHLKRQIPALIEKWEGVMGVKVKEWGTKRMKTKWGTCSIEAKRIWLNLELAKKPLRCVEYIIVHEMTHLLERHHNDRFLAYLGKYLPNWRAVREELNRGVLEV